MRTLRELRVIHGVKQTQLAEAVGVPQPVISYLEIGVVLPNPIIKQKIEQFFGEKIDWELMATSWRTRLQDGKIKPAETRIR